MPRYHRCMKLEDVVYGGVVPNPNHEKGDFLPAYRWLEREVGFYPLFLSVGESEAALRMTGYNNQWRRIIAWSSKGNTYRRRGEFPNYVLFSFEHIDGIFMDFEHWHIAINAALNDRGEEVTSYEKRLMFKPSWPGSRWLRKARKDPGSVQLVTPRLFLPEAGRIWVRNRKTKQVLEEMGFQHIEVKRLKVPSRYQ